MIFKTLKQQDLLEEKLHCFDIVTLGNALEVKVNLQNMTDKLKESIKLKILEKKERETQTQKNVIRLLRGRQ